MPDIKIIADLREHEQQRVAILEDGKLAEIFIEYSSQTDDDGTPDFARYNAKISRLSRQGDIFKARIDTVVPAINAAFVALTSKDKNRGRNPDSRNAFMFLNDSKKGLKSGQNVIVQITKNARQNKAPRVSTRVSVPGRWLVIVPDSDELGVSRRISDNSERKRLKKIAEDLQAKTPGFGIVIRTAAEGMQQELLESDLQSLLKLWDDIKRKAEHSHSPCLLYRDTGTLGRVLRDDITGHVDEIIVDDQEEFERSQGFIERFFPADQRPGLSLYTGTTPIFEYFGIEQEIQKAVDRKVWLRSGAYLVIDQTEALTVIDVNTGKFISAPDMRHTILATNLEAAEEIARQLRLRAIGGIVVVDFIDMEEEQDKHELIRHFSECVAHDRLKARVFSITQLGLVELTRKRERSDLRSMLTKNCPLCGGDGFVEREESIAVKIKRFVRKIVSANNSEAFILQTSKFMAEYIYQFLDEWEQEFSRKILIASMHSYEADKFRLDFQGDIQSAEARAKQLRLEGKGHTIIYRV